MYQDLRDWLSNPGSLPPDDVQTTIDSLAFSNRTMFTHRSAWTTMVAGGQFPFLVDPSLVSRIGELYENVIVRLDWNSKNYDRELWRVMRETVPTYWDSETKRLLTEDPRELSVLRGQVRYIHLVWNRWYLEFLETYRSALDALIADVEMYLRSHGESI